MEQTILCSPFLPGWEYIPDGEPHIFGDRLYLFGSHDRFGGKRFCLNDYVVWSAPLSDLSAWKYEGVSYRKDQDPDNPRGKLELWAPDAAQGPDGRYYLYYCLANHPKIGVAVSDKPEGPYSFLDHVHDRDGVPLGQREYDTRPFDPAVLVDSDGKIHLYSGQGPLTARHMKQENNFKCTYHMELEADMVTLKTEPVPLIPSLPQSAGTGFEGHEFHEGSSIRRFGEKYYFIYSSVQCHELCWAVSNRPDGDFRFGGTLISNGDIGLNGQVTMSFNSKADPAVRNYIGNNHGSVEKIGGRYYVFYHRHTNRHMFSRQACVTPIEMLPDGSFSQAEMTSSGFADSLPGKGFYDARITCQLYSAEGALFSTSPRNQNRKHPFFTQDEPDGMAAKQYIANLRNGATAVFKSFDMDDTSEILVTVRGKANGNLIVRATEHGPDLACVEIKPSRKWTVFQAPMKAEQGRHPLYFTYMGVGALDFIGFELL